MQGQRLASEVLMMETGSRTRQALWALAIYDILQWG